MKRLGFVIFALAAYTIFTGTFLYLIAFIAGAPGLPRSIDHPGSALPTTAAVLADLGLVALFGVHHSVMARQGFKAVWTRVVPVPIERSCYMLFTCLSLGLLFAFWQPIPALAWDTRGRVGYPLLWALFAAGWALAFLSTHLIDHFELFGLRQAFRNWRAAPPQAPEFRKPLFYRWVRHPLYSGFTIAFWAAPVMSYGHLLFAAAMTVYILVGIAFEERDLVALFGKEYEAYREKVGKLIPKVR